MALEAVTVLRQESTAMDRNWNRRYRDNMDKLKAGDIFKVAEVVRNLMRTGRDKGLSAGETKMLHNAKQILISELILACGFSEEEAEKLIEETV